MPKFLVELKSSDEKKSYKLDFKNEADAKAWGVKQTEVWKWNSARVVVTPIVEVPVTEETKVVEESKDVHVKQVEARKKAKAAAKGK